MAPADDERLAERLTQVVTAGVERGQRSALVVSHGLVVAKYKGKPTDPRAVGYELNVRYLVEGEVLDENGAIVVMAQLVETKNGTQVWSSRVAAPLGSDGKGEIAANVANRVQQALYDAEKKRVASLPREGANQFHHRLLRTPPGRRSRRTARPRAIGGPCCWRASMQFYR